MASDRNSLPTWWVWSTPTDTTRGRSSSLSKNP